MDKPQLGKRQEFAELLNNGIAALHLDGRVDGVRVPRHLRSRSWLVLNFSYGYRLLDFNFDDDGVQGSLSFGGSPFPCFIPWEAVFAMSDDNRDTFHMWQEDMPAEAMASLTEASEAAVVTELSTPRPHRGAKPALAVATRDDGPVTAEPATEVSATMDSESAAEAVPHKPASTKPAPAKPASAKPAGRNGRKAPVFAVIDGGGERSSGPGGKLERIK